MIDPFNIFTTASLKLDIEGEIGYAPAAVASIRDRPRNASD